MGPEHYALPLAELVGQATQLADLELVQHLLVRPLGSGIDDRVPDRSSGLAVHAELLLHATRSALRRLKALQLLQREAGRIAQLFVRRLRAICLHVLTTCGLDQSEPSDRPVGQCDRPG